MSVMPESGNTALVLTASFCVVLIGAALLWTLWWHDGSSVRIAQGRQLYGAYCASCHGADLQGEPDWQGPKPNGLMPAPPHDATGYTWHHSDEELFRITKLGMAAVVPNYESAMPAFGNVLSDQEIKAILAFIKSTWPERERTYQQERSRP